MTHRPDVAFLLPNLQGGGAERVFLNLASEFTRRGVDTELVLACSEGVFMEQAAPAVKLVELERPNELRALGPLARHLRRSRPRVVVSALNTMNLVAVAAVLASRSQSALWLTQHSDMTAHATNDESRRARLFPHLARAVFPWANGWICVSEAVADDLARRCQIPRQQIRVIYNPLDIARIRRLGGAASGHPWLAERRGPVLVAAGRLVPQKDFATAIRGLASLRATHPDARLIILGEGGQRARLEALVSELRLDQAVDMPGFSDNPYSYFREADALVLSSAWEGFGNVLVEAMALGTPVVATDCPSGPAEVVGHGQWGRLVPPGDPAALARALTCTLAEAPDTQSLASRAEQFDLGPIVDRYLSVLSPSFAPNDARRGAES